MPQRLQARSCLQDLIETLVHGVQRFVLVHGVHRGMATSVASRRSRQSCSPSTAACLTSCRRLRSRRSLCEFRHGSLCTCLRTLATRASGGRALLSTESCYPCSFALFYPRPLRPLRASASLHRAPTARQPAAHPGARPRPVLPTGPPSSPSPLLSQRAHVRAQNRARRAPDREIAPWVVRAGALAAAVLSAPPKSPPAPARRH